MKNKLTFTTLAALAGFSGAAHAQIFLTPNAPYAQDFDSLINTDGASATFTDDTTITGWYVNSEEMDSNSDEYFAEDGTSGTGEVYSFGAAGATDRALGYVGSGGNDYFNVAVRLVNDSSSAVTELDISYVGEQWRSGGDTSDNNNFLDFSYRTFSASGGSIPADTSLTGWTEVDALDFTPPQPSVAAGNLDGNLAANRTALSETITGLSWGAGDELWLRWTGNDGVPGSDAGIGIDDFSVTAIPEPSACVLLAGLFGLTWMMRGRREA